MRAAARLNTHAIEDSVASDTDAPRLTLVLALLAAAGVFLPWAEGIRWSNEGSSYVHGLLALAAAAASALICVLRLFGVIDRQRYFQLGLACALIGLGATLVFYFDVVGSTDPVFYRILASWFGRPTTRGAVGFYVSMAGFLGQVGVLLWHLDFVIQRRARIALQSPWTAVALIGVAAVGVLLPWNEVLTSPERGWSYNEGLIALVAAIEAGIVCGLRLSGRIRLVPYTVVGLLYATAGFGAVAWFHITAVGPIDPTGYPLLVWWLNGPRTEAGLRESVSAAGFIGLMAILIWQLWQGTRSNIY